MGSQSMASWVMRVSRIVVVVRTWSARILRRNPLTGTGKFSARRRGALPN
jgi:hypothetical protein